MKAKATVSTIESKYEDKPSFVHRITVAAVRLLCKRVQKYRLVGRCGPPECMEKNSA